MDGAARGARRRHPRLDPVPVRQPRRDDHRARRADQSRPGGHPGLRRHGGLRHRLPHRLALGRRRGGGPRGGGVRPAARADLLAAAGQRRRGRHRPDAVRRRPRLLPRQAVHPALGPAAAGDPVRVLVGSAAGPGGVAGQRAVPGRRASERRPVVGLPQHQGRPGDPGRRRQRRGGPGHGLPRHEGPGARHHGGGRARRDRRRLPVPVLSGLVERGHLVGPGADGGRARHLRPLEPARLLRRGAPVRRRRGARPRASIGRRLLGLLPVLRRALRPHTRAPRRHLVARPGAGGGPGRAGPLAIFHRSSA